MPLQTDIKATDTVPPPAPPKFLEGSGSADVMLATADSLSDSGRALSRLDISRQHQEESTVDFDPSSESSPENGESIYDFDTGDTPDYATDYNAEMAAGRAHDDVTIIGLPTASRILPEWKLDSGAVNIVLENRTSRPIVLFADEARPGAKDSIRTAWKVSIGASEDVYIWFSLVDSKGLFCNTSS